MKNKIAALVAGTILTLTASSAPSHALNVRGNFVSNPSTNSETINLDNGLNQTNDGTATKQLEAENGEVLIAGRRYRRRSLRRRRRRGYRRFRNRIINRGTRRRIYRRIGRPNNRRTWQRNRPVRRYRYRYRRYR